MVDLGAAVGGDSLDLMVLSTSLAIRARGTTSKVTSSPVRGIVARTSIDDSAAVVGQGEIV